MFDAADGSDVSASAYLLISALFFTWFFAASFWTVNALRSPVRPGKGLTPLWLPGMLINELAPAYFVLRILIAWGFVALGSLDRRIGVLGLWLFIAAQFGLLVIIGRGIVSARRVGSRPSVWSMWKIWEPIPSAVEHQVEIPYHDNLTLDTYRKPGIADAPTLVYVHPGSWMRGRPGRQARSLFYRLASRGWLILDIRYPLSPDATFPEHLVGVKRAIAWARGPGVAYGCDPERVVISGGSSGAHLAALAALTSSNRDLQPGFESADTSVAAAMVFYGIYDLLVRNSTRYDWPFIARFVLKATPDENRDLYHLGSPVDQVHPNAPPFLVTHGTYDSIVLPDESRHFVTALDDVGVDAELLEVHWAQHGFDAVASLRTRAVAEHCVDWIESRLAGEGSESS